MEDTTLNLSRLAPVALYTYTRHEHFVRTVEALKLNFLAPHTVLYVVSDAPSIAAHEAAVGRIRDYADNLTGFREIVRVYRDKNLGLRLSPPMAEKAILSDHGKIINMEDDNISSSNYLDFVNGGLQYFEDDDSVFSVSGYAPPTAGNGDTDDGDFWFYPWNISWGYGLWKAKYDKIYPLVNRYPVLKKQGILSAQNRQGGLYISDSLKRDFENKKYFPDAILCTEMFRRQARTILPTVSKIQNIGQDGSGQSSNLLTDKYNVALDLSAKRNFYFANECASAQQKRNAAIALYNGSRLTRLARRIGVFHELSSMRSKLLGK
jgi:hypothetical protein